MRIVVLTSLVFIVAIGILAGCTSRDAIGSQTQKPSAQTSQSPSPPPPADTARRITAAEAYKLYEKGNVVVIDTRTEAAFKESHIKGAILVPVNEVAAKANELPHDKFILAYCT
jgi:3-mercaptopyruvate sulfurtransferase SseA